MDTEKQADFPPEFKILAVLFLNAQKGYQLDLKKIKIMLHLLNFINNGILSIRSLGY